MEGDPRSVYDRALHDLYDVDARWQREQAECEAWQETLASVLARGGMETEAAQARQPDRFEPGADLNGALAHAAHQVAVRATLVPGIDPVPFFAGAWPDGSANARAQRLPGGGVVYVNTGLIWLLRILAQYTAGALAFILDNPRLGADVDRGSTRELAEDLFVRLLTGEHRPYHLSAWAMTGPRNAFRRNLLGAAVDFVVAHEYGHLVNAEYRGGLGCVSLDLSGLVRPRTEGQELNAQHDELQADITAWRILLADAGQAPVEHLVTAALGGCLALAAQTAIYRIALAMGSDDYGWSHPAPEIRVPALYEALAERDLQPARTYSDRFMEWAEESFAIAEARRRGFDRLERRHDGR